ncbi:MAG TPA: protein kinase [Kofleriaceae bacterium]|nr:protein kinase [Kofleriaceae bacterium]
MSSRPTRLGRYELITRIGQGGMAEVQLALQRGPAGFEKLVVVKLVHDSLASQKAFVDMLLDEARVAALVKHPNVVDIYDLGQAEGRYFIAMEYLEGEPLLGVLRAGREGKRLDVLSTGRLIADTAEGLDAAHELRSMSGDRLELVHHDISLGNIVVLYNGQVKLVDFGVAKATQSAGPRAKVQGKFSYMAPEKLRGSAGDRRSDIFSLGCVMWEALTLKRLFRGGNDAETMKQVLEVTIQPPSKVNREVPPEYDAIVMRALDRDPERRHRTAKELAVEIEELLRKRGYGAKNDKIAHYMQETFKSHIDARKKLVQEVVSKGSASAEVLDAAFREPALAAGSPVTPVGAASEFSVRNRHVPPTAEHAPRQRHVAPATGVPVPTAAWADSSPRTTISPPPVHPMFDGGPGTGTDIAPVDEDAAAKPAADAEATRQGVPLSVRMRALTSRISPITERTKALLADRRKRLYVAAGAGALLLVIVIVALASGGGDRPAAVAAGKTVGDDDRGAVPAEIADASVAIAADPADKIEILDEPAVPSDHANAAEPPDKPGAAAKPERRDRPERHDKPERHDRPERVVKRPPPIDVVDTVNKGLRAFVTGDSKAALALLQKARSAKPGYAPTYRVLGKVYKKLGERGPAKSAYQRYLRLAPGASDAEQIRKELAEL